VQKSTQATSDVQNINVSTTNSFAHNRQERLNGGQTGFSLNGTSWWANRLQSKWSRCDKVTALHVLNINCLTRSICNVHAVVHINIFKLKRKTIRIRRPDLI